jgi:ATP sulfurylase
LLHALIRQNFGCSHLIVGRDHAGVGDYYGPFDAHHAFDELWEGALHTRALKIDITFYCRKCYGMATAKTCPHDPQHHISISGTKQREMLSTDADIPPEFSRPEVVAILREYYASLRSTGNHDRRANLRHAYRAEYIRRGSENKGFHAHRCGHERARSGPRRDRPYRGYRS